MMQSKSLLIAIAAFAVTTTGVHAYGGGKLLVRAGLSEEQVSALEEAHELRAQGQLAEARDRLVAAGVTEQTLRNVHLAAKEARHAMHEALAADDYEAFQEAILGTPLADVITSEAEFDEFREAHELRHEGQWQAAADILEDLGVSPLSRQPLRGHHHGFVDELSEEQHEAFLVARQANDRATMQAILDEAGVSLGHMHRGWSE